MKLFLLLAITSLYAADHHQNQHPQPPVLQAPNDNPAPYTYTRLSPEERAHIAARISHDTIAKMADDLGRAWSTVYREIARNADWDGAYRAAGAQRKYEDRQRNSHQPH